MKKRNAKPVVKWLGGKKRLLPKLLELMPKNIHHYGELFFGGGALFFEAWNQGRLDNCKSLILNDKCKNLMKMYRGIQINVNELIDNLKVMSKESNKEDFLFYRQSLPSCNCLVSIASMFIYLNKNTFNGLYRENKKGGLNMPFAERKNTPKLYDEDSILDVCKALEPRSLFLTSMDVIEIINEHYLTQVLPINTFLYLDPPYDPISKTSSFTGYTSDGFTEEDQTYLSEAFKKLSDKGYNIMLTNSNTDLIRGLYKDFNIHPVEINRTVAASYKGRKKVTELIITNY